MKDISAMNFGEALQYVRKSNQEYSSRIKLSAKTGIDTRTISYIEKGESLPTKKQLHALCDALGDEQLREKGLSEIEYVDVKENETYRWDEETRQYVCIGTDYRAIKIINGGNAKQ